jgi:hypothetical protein
VVATHSKPICGKVSELDGERGYFDFLFLPTKGVNQRVINFLHHRYLAIERDVAHLTVLQELQNATKCH